MLKKQYKEIIEQLDRIENLIQTFKQQEEEHMSQLDDTITALVAKVTAEDTVIDSAVVLVNGIPALIQTAVAAAIAAGATPAQLQAFTDLGTTIDAKAGELSTAVAANAPAPAPAPAPVPVVGPTGATGVVAAAGMQQGGR